MKINKSGAIFLFLFFFVCLFEIQSYKTRHKQQIITFEKLKPEKDLAFLLETILKIAIANFPVD